MYFCLYSAYQPTIAIGIHGMVAQIARPVIEWPKSFQRYSHSHLKPCFLQFTHSISFDFH